MRESGWTTWSTAKQRCSRSSSAADLSSSSSACDMLPFLATLTDVTYKSWKWSLVAIIVLSAGEVVDSLRYCRVLGEGESSVKDGWSVFGCFRFSGEDEGLLTFSSAIRLAVECLKVKRKIGRFRNRLTLLVATVTVITVSLCRWRRWGYIIVRIYNDTWVP